MPPLNAAPGGILRMTEVLRSQPSPEGLAGERVCVS